MVDGTATLKPLVFYFMKDNHNQYDDFKFIDTDWNTPNTYNTNYKYPPDKSGVYLITIRNSNNQFLILYVGSSKNLRVRYEKHEVMRTLNETFGYVQFYFKEEIEYKQIEKKLIKQIQPKYNTQWR